MAMTEQKPDAVIPIARLDHFVMPCRDVDISADFYVRVLGATKVTFGEGRIAIQLGSQKVNLQPSGRCEGLCAPNHLPGTQDFCVITEMPLGEVKAALEAQGIEIIEGPVQCTGARGPLKSLYFRDPDGNVVEISNQA